MVPLHLAKAVTLFERGVIAVENGKPERAVSAFKEALRMQPNYLEAKIALGQTLIELGDDEGALEILHNAYAQSPTNPGVLAALGLAHFALLEIEDAIGYWKQAFELSEEDLPAELAEEIGTTLCTGLQMMGEFEAAEGILAQLERRLPESVSVQFSAAEFFFTQQQFDNSLRHAERAVQLDAENAETYLLIAKIQLERKAIPLAFAALDSAQKYDPFLPGIEATRALLYLHNHEYDEALKIADAVIDEDELERDEIYNCAVVYATIGDTEQAEDLLREILEDDPDDIEAGTALVALAESSKNIPLLTWCRENITGDDPELQAAIDECIQRIKPAIKIVRPRMKR